MLVLQAVLGLLVFVFSLVNLFAQERFTKTKKVNSTHQSPLGQWSYGKFVRGQSEASIALFDKVLASSYLPYPFNYDAASLKQKLTSTATGIKILVLGDRALPAKIHKQLEALCLDVSASCAFIYHGNVDHLSTEAVEQAKTLPLFVVRSRQELRDCVHRIGDPDLSLQGPLIFVFSSQGKLVWLSDSDSLEFSIYELEVVTRSITAYELGFAAPANVIKEIINAQPSSVTSINSPIVAEKMKPKISDLHGPVFTLPDGVKTTLAESWIAKQKKPRLFVFWGTWCQACMVEMPLLKSLWEQYGKQVMFAGFAFQAKDSGTRAEIQQVLTQSGLSYTQYIIADQEIPRIIQGLDEETDLPFYPSFALFSEKGDLVQVYVKGLRDPGTYESIKAALNTAGNNHE